jgi:hypothetical protein
LYNRHVPRIMFDHIALIEGIQWQIQHSVGSSLRCPEWLQGSLASIYSFTWFGAS